MKLFDWWFSSVKLFDWRLSSVKPFDWWFLLFSFASWAPSWGVVRPRMCHSLWQGDFNRKQVVNRLKIPQGLSTQLFHRWIEVPSRGGVRGDSPYKKKFKKKKKKKPCFTQRTPHSLWQCDFSCSLNPFSSASFVCVPVFMFLLLFFAFFAFFFFLLFFLRLCSA